LIGTKYEEEINCRADMKFEMARDKRKKKEKWSLVPNPISVRGMRLLITSRAPRHFKGHHERRRLVAGRLYMRRINSLGAVHTIARARTR
jgi:hypothetical protein